MVDPVDSEKAPLYRILIPQYYAYRPNSSANGCLKGLPGRFRTHVNGAPASAEAPIPPLTSPHHQSGTQPGVQAFSLTSATMSVSTFFASPKTMTVLSLSKSSFRIPAKPGLSERLMTTTVRDSCTFRIGIP